MVDRHFHTLEEWLSWQEQLHPSEIELGLERVYAVAEKLQILPELPTAIVVAGTNGKGSTIACMESILRSGGYRVGVYTSPHLFVYNERVRVDGATVSDEVLCAAFEKIDEARGDISLTYFEFGTLAALLIFAEAELDVILLEVGMGGRLDAVNIVDADVAVITTIGLDHQDWLGDDLEAIGAEKAGIIKKGCAVVLGDKMPDSVLKAAEESGVDCKRLNRDFSIRFHGKAWDYISRQHAFQGLPVPALSGAHQLNNAAVAITALLQLHGLRLEPEMLATGLSAVTLAGRIQKVFQQCEWVLDVSHNVQAVTELANWLEKNPVAGKTCAIFSILRDKDVHAVVEQMENHIDHWFVAGLSCGRGYQSDELISRLNLDHDKITSVIDPDDAVDKVLDCVNQDGRVVVFGSFYTVSAVANKLNRMRNERK